MQRLMKVMLIDDEPAIREQAKVFLKDIFGLLDVRTFGSAVEALDELEESYYSAVVSDYRMPEMDGIELLQKIREKGNDVPFIIFTGKGKEEVAMKALNLGADGYIQKSDDPKAQYVLMAQTIKQVVERHQSDNALVRSEREKSMILDSLSEQVVHLDKECTVIWGNRAASSSVGSKPGELVGKKCYELWFDREEPCRGCPMLKAAELKSRADAIIPSDDGRIWYIRTEPVISHDGDLEGYLEIKDDITEREKAKEAFLSSEKKFLTLVETAPSAVMILESGHLRYFNRATEHITGYSEDELMDMKIYDIISEEQRDLVEERLEELQRGLDNVPTRYEVEIRRADGDRILLYISTGLLNFEGEDCILMIAMDLSDRKQLDDMLRDGFTRSFSAH